MKFLKRTAAVVVLILCMAAFAGCADGGLSDLSKNMSTYTINAQYDDTTHTVTANMSVDYVNNYNVELKELQFHLYGAAYREGARFSPIAANEESAAYPSGKSYGGMEVSAVKVKGAEQTPVIGGSDNDILVVNLGGDLLPGAKISLSIDFKVTLANVRHRLGWYGKSVNLGNFYPVACVYEDGAFRAEPYYSNGDPFYSEAANYNVTLQYPSKYKMASTGKSTDTAGDGVVVSTVKAEAVRDFAVVLGEFEVMTATAGETSINYYYYADAAPEKSLQAAVDSVTTFSEMFGAYPYDNYDVVQTAFLQGGMEYPNLSMISDALNASVYVDAIVHETAHQWWYGVVGNDEIKNAWMDEALTEYSTSLFYSKHAEYNVDFEKRIGDALSAYLLYTELYKPGLNADTSMNRSLGEYVDNMEYTYMTYVKGQLMFDNLRRTIGDDNFYSALKKYYTENYLKIAAPDNMIACFEKTSARELKSYFNSWIEGKVQLYNK